MRNERKRQHSATLTNKHAAPYRYLAYLNGYWQPSQHSQHSQQQRQGIELGRSFIQPSCRKKHSLDYLWMDLGAYLAKHPQVKYIFGAVSIANNYPSHAKQKIVVYFKHHYQHKSTTKLAFACNRGLSLQQGMLKLKKNLKHQNQTLSTPYKHHANFCDIGGVNFIDFNINPGFSFCIAGLVIADFRNCKSKQTRPLFNPFQTLLGK